MSVAALQSVVVAVLAVCAVASMAFSVLAERRRSSGVAGLRWLGAVCAVLAGLAYAVPVGLVLH